jgi:hypothetical protein
MYVQTAAAMRSLEDKVVTLHEALAKTREQEWQAQEARDEALREQLRAHHSEVLATLTETVHSIGASGSCESCGHHRAPPKVPRVPDPPVTVRRSVDEAGPSRVSKSQGAPAEPPAQVRVRYADPMSLRSVSDILKEFEEDHPNGKRSVNWLERNASKTWRKEFGVDRKRLNEMRVVYDGVIAYSNFERINRETAASKMESWRRRENMSIRQFFEKVRALRVICKNKHEKATTEVKAGRIEKDFGDLLGRHCMDV